VKKDEIQPEGCQPEETEAGRGRTGGKSVVGGLRDRVLANLMQLSGGLQQKKIRHTM